MPRLFIAITLPADLSVRVEAQRKELARVLPGGTVRWTRSPTGALQHHITLLFLGDTPPEQVPPIREVMEQVAATTAPLHLHIGAEGAFFQRGRVRVLWRGVEGDTGPLQEVATALAQRLQDPPRRQSFTPHLTLGRVCREARLSRESWQHALDVLPSREPLDFSVGEIILFASTLTRLGATHEALHTAALCGTTP